MTQSVDDGNNLRVFRQTRLLFCGNKRPELVDVDGGAPEEVAGEVEVTHTNLTEVTRMVLIEVGSVNVNVKCELIRMYVFLCARGWEWGRGDVPVVVSTTSETATSRVLAVLAYTTVTGGDVSSVLASLGQMSRRLSQKRGKG